MIWMSASYVGLGVRYTSVGDAVGRYVTYVSMVTGSALSVLGSYLGGSKVLTVEAILTD